MIRCNKICFQLAKRMVLLLLLTGISNAIYADSHSYHYSKATIKTSNGSGKVYVSATATAPTFTGTAVDVSVTGNYDKATVKSAGFTGTEATISHELVKTDKQITAN